MNIIGKLMKATIAVISQRRIPLFVCLWYLVQWCPFFPRWFLLIMFFLRLFIFLWYGFNGGPFLRERGLIAIYTLFRCIEKPVCLVTRVLPGAVESYSS